MSLVVSDPRAEQCAAALERANTVRLARAQIKREIAIGTLDVRELLADPPWTCLRMPVAQLIAAVPRYGPKRTRYLLRGVDPHLVGTRPIGKLTPRQRELIADAVVL